MAGTLDLWRWARSHDWDFEEYKRSGAYALDPKYGQPWTVFTASLYWSFFGRPCRARDEVFALDLSTEERGLWNQPYDQAASAFAALDARAAARLGEVSDWWILQAEAQARRWNDRTAQLHIAGLALAAKAFKHDRGVYPNDLQELATYLHRSLPLNPFTGKAYGYERRGEGFALSIPGDPDAVAKGNVAWQCDK
jgi:hypothetical protein